MKIPYKRIPKKSSKIDFAFNMENYWVRDLTRGDKALLVAAGVRGILTHSTEDED